ncbi:hypothetical protein [Halobacillus massiliensis]|uniref:hypothetical protein n=1 Tax=Halobacillus massiliensis TaxID=1926286 RepID=UPI0009E473EE|nr:hypothetical protein [Halobacillus massiliensis]
MGKSFSGKENVSDLISRLNQLEQAQERQKLHIRQLQSASKHNKTSADFEKLTAKLLQSVDEYLVQVTSRYEKELAELRKRVQQLEMQVQNSGKNESIPHNSGPIFIVDHLKLDKLETNNNFGQLGINELSGTLNIGNTEEQKSKHKKIKQLFN